MQTFASWLYANRNNSAAPSDREESGKYLWWLWQIGATLQGIHWYVEERAKYHDHGSMASEYPSDDIEAFVNSGTAVFDKYCVEALRPTTVKPPRYIGDIYAYGDEGEDALRDLRFKADSQGLLYVWNLPDSIRQVADNDWVSSLSTDTEEVTDRYLTVVDVGGRSHTADWSVIVVFDRLLMMDGGKPSVVAQWYGHIDMDLLAWKAAQIAAFYDNSLLVIESNTLETHDRERNVDGDQSNAILTKSKIFIQTSMHVSSPRMPLYKVSLCAMASTRMLPQSRWLSLHLSKWYVRALYVERDKRCIDEYLNYEKRPNGSFGAKAGTHDDLLMTRAIGLHICFYEMQLPQS